MGARHGRTRTRTRTPHTRGCTPHARTHAHAHAHTHTRTHTHTHEHTHARTHARTHIHTRAHARTRNNHTHKHAQRTLPQEYGYAGNDAPDLQAVLAARGPSSAPAPRRPSYRPRFLPRVDPCACVRGVLPGAKLAILAALSVPAPSLAPAAAFTFGRLGVWNLCLPRPYRFHSITPLFS